MSRILQQGFDSFTAAGFSAAPAAGQLDSRVWRVVGLSDEPAPAYGFSAPAGGDFGRGVITTNDPTTAGVYAPGADPALVLQPTGAELDAGGFIEARVQNISGEAATGFLVDFDWVARNSAPRADNLTFSWSVDGTNFTEVPAAAFSSPAAAEAGAGFVGTALDPITLPGTVAPGDYLTLRWTHAGSAGAGNRDEVGIDNLTVDTLTGGTPGGGTPGGGTPTPAPDTTPIMAVQGSGAASPLLARTVTVTGIVTAVSTGTTKGFYLQDPQGDADAATSDAILVFTGSTPTVAVGDQVQVTGRVTEFLPSGAAPGALATTELSAVSGLVTLSRGNPLPAAVVIGPDGVQPPDASFADGNAFWESLEAMRVLVQAPLVVGPTNGFGEITTVAGGGAGASGLNGRGDLLITGGAASFGFTDSQGGDLNPERVQIDPGLGVTLPKVSTGARLGDVSGVVGYDFGNYQVLATAAPDIVAPSKLTKDAATLAGDADHLLVASYNAENLDPGDGAARFATIAAEILAKLNAPDVLALQEVQDNNGATDNGVTAADMTLRMIVDAIAAAGGPRYDFIDNPFIGNDSNGGEPGGNIRTAFLYRPDRVALVDGSLATVAADGSRIAAPGGNGDQQTNPDNPFFASRPPLSAAFTFNGQAVTVLSNHFTSKGGSGVLFGAAQPPFDAGEVQRAAQAQAVNTYVDGILAQDPAARVIVTGDLNDFGFEQPLSVLRGVASISGYDVPARDAIAATATYTPGGTAILTDLQDSLPPDQRFDYVFEGNAETLDHMLATSALAAGAQFQPVHINAEFFDQTSDHDPLVGRFAIPATPATPPENPSMPLNIVLTNDDGYNAPGIQTLYQALASAGFNVHIVAPAANQSAQGSSLGGVAALVAPIAITQFSPGNYYVDGRPAAATLVALDDLFAGNPPDLVISGTNRGENIGESENISGTVNGALQALFEGVPAIAISAGSFNGSYDAAFANSANFMVDFLNQLVASRGTGAPVLPAGQGLSINVPGNPILGGIAVTTINDESTSAFPYAPTGPDTYAEGFVPVTAPSGSTTAEGAQFLSNRITISPVDGNWGSAAADREALAVRLGGAAGSVAPATGPLDILLINEDGAGAPGIVATRQALLARGYDVTVLAPATDQSGVGSALFLNPVTVTRYEAGNYASTGTPASLVSLGLDPQGLLAGARPDLVVVGADQGSAVGIENANHSATLAAAATALFNYQVPAIALTAASGTPTDFATAAGFLAKLIGNLQATQGNAAALLPDGVGLSINVPAGASAADFAFTTIDGASDADLGVSGNAQQAGFVRGGALGGGGPDSEGAAFNAGKITVSPIDGNIAVRAPSAYADLAGVVGTQYGTPTGAPATLSFQVSEDAYQGNAQFVVTVNGQQIGGVQTATAAHSAGQSAAVTLLDFFSGPIDQVAVRFVNDSYGGSDAADRNLYVDKLTLNGQVYQGEFAGNGAGDNLPTEAALWGNGTLTFATSDTLVLRVSGDAYDGDAQFVVSVNGAEVGGTQTATARHSLGEYQDITLTGSFGDPHSVAISFLNDRWDGSSATDRNLYVDQVSVSGRVYQAEQAATGGAVLPNEAALWNNGTLQFAASDGIRL